MLRNIKEKIPSIKTLLSISEFAFGHNETIDDFLDDPTTREQLFASLKVLFDTKTIDGVNFTPKTYPHHSNYIAAAKVSFHFY